MNRDEIMQILPHRDDMLLLEEAYLGEDGAAHGKYTVRGDEFFLRGHFPGNPIVRDNRADRVRAAGERNHRPHAAIRGH